MNISPILSDLNDVQRDAVTSDFTKPLLMIAGAGSGKTRVLTRRIAYFIDQGISPFQILGIAFTNKAAGEMRKRVQTLIRSHVWIATFHSTCLQILRMDGEKIGLRRNFAIYDDTDQLVLIKECMKDLEINERQTSPKAVREMIQRAKDGLKAPAAFSAEAEDYYEMTVSRIYALYQQKLSILHGCDFGDLIMQTVRLFRDYPAVLSSWQNRFRYLFIDEYQDTNQAQYVFVERLALRHRQITVVGDPDQSIYAWRGADIQNILRFEQDYPNCRVLNLEQNYRSSQTILDAANNLIQNNHARKPKLLWTENGEGEKITVYEAADEKEEAVYVIRKISEYVQNGQSLAGMVIFYRVHAQSRIFEDVLRQANIHYKIIGGVRFYDRREIKDLIAYLRIIAAEDDPVSLKRIMNVPSRGIGKKALLRIESYRAAAGVTLFQALCQIDQIEGIGAKTKEAVHFFTKLVRRLKSEQKEKQVSELLGEVLEGTGYTNNLEIVKTIDGRARLENIKEFYSVVQEFEENWDPVSNLFYGGEESHANPPSSLLEAFLESIALQSGVDEWNDESQQLNLMTFHCAKGLEFPVVFMPGLEDGIFPHIRSKFGEMPDDLEEERRLCYVGMTRAKYKLHLSYANSRRLYGTRERSRPSRFLSEIPPSLYDDFNRWDERIELEPEMQADEPKRRLLFG